MADLTWAVLIGDVREQLQRVPSASVQCVVTSPPYFGLRNYGHAGQIGLERSADAYVAALVAVFREVKRVLRDDGVLWLNLGDSMEAKHLVGIPWRVAFALQADGWCLRSDVIWAKPNPMPESTTDRPSKAHEYIFLLTKAEQYYYDAEAIRETPKQRAQAKGTSNCRSVWTITTQSYPEAHVATFPPELPTRCIRAGSSESGACRACGAPLARVVVKGAPDREQQRASGGDKDGAYAGQAVKPYAGTGAQNPSDVKRRILKGMTTRTTTHWVPTCKCDAAQAGDIVPCVVLDPFAGSGTTGAVAIQLQRSFVGIDLNPAYVALARKRISVVAPLFATELDFPGTVAVSLEHGDDDDGGGGDGGVERV